MELQSLQEAAIQVEIQCHQAVGPFATKAPLKVPQVSSLQRLAGQGPAVLPQVRPKTVIPDSLPAPPCRDRPSKQSLVFQKATVVSTKNPSPALPTANNTVGHGQPPGSQSPPGTAPLTSPGVALAIISAAPSRTVPGAPGAPAGHDDDAAPGPPPLLLRADSKVLLIQPQVQTQPNGSKVEPKKPSEEAAQGVPATKRSKEENPEKIAFMVALGLVTTEHLEEIQSKRHERKRRSTANPAYSGLLDSERKRLAPSYLNSPLFLPARANEDPCWKSQVPRDEHCTTCRRGANLQPCGTCPRAFHLQCLDPPLRTAPRGLWGCPTCQQQALKKEDETEPWTGTLAIVHSYVTHKSAKEEEKERLVGRGGELQSQQRQLEERARLLGGAVQADPQRPHDPAHHDHHHSRRLLVVVLLLLCRHLILLLIAARTLDQDPARPHGPAQSLAAAAGQQLTRPPAHGGRSAGPSDRRELRVAPVLGLGLAAAAGGGGNGALPCLAAAHHLPLTRERLLACPSLSVGTTQMGERSWQGSTAQGQVPDPETVELIGWQR
ncbi:PHD finger protein 21B isoform X2 [Tachyglossus aculeatus]|uniref:PHD finger protein 21B isoform X2 n=1 Tax=Tachyglossus aculeatus TaxID=9261 RepID=UPI0018F550E4|nr:PHD finger protein 21B isoform X2 [Tachyglossus aculeatus]